MKEWLRVSTCASQHFRGQKVYDEDRLHMMEWKHQLIRNASNLAHLYNFSDMDAQRRDAFEKLTDTISIIVKGKYSSTDMELHICDG